MSTMRKSCGVAFPKGCNNATSPSTNATSHATGMQPTSLKALAAKVLIRNQQRNRDATGTKQPCNFSPENNPLKLFDFGTCNQDAPSHSQETHSPEELTEFARLLPKWCNPRCEHYHRAVIPGLETLQWCCLETDATHWRRDRLDRMMGCPSIDHTKRQEGL